MKGLGGDPEGIRVHATVWGGGWETEAKLVGRVTSRETILRGKKMVGRKSATEH